MTSAREEILRRAASAAGPVVVPRDYHREDPADSDAVGLLTHRLVDYRATVTPCPQDGLPAAVAAALARSSCVVAPADLPEWWLSQYPGERVKDLQTPGVSVVTGCAVAVAQTGTIILDAGFAQGGRALTLVPDHHVCVVFAHQIAVTLPVALGRLSDRRRPLTFISGPSATSDIELNRVEGVHGPRRLDVVVVRQ